jgi:excisionase family DNA binding protein
MSGASRLLTVKEVSERTGVQLWRSYELLKRGEGPPHLRTARVIRIPEKAVDQWIEEETQRTSATAARKRAAGSAWFRPGPGASHSRPATAPTTCAEKRSRSGSRSCRGGGVSVHDHHAAEPASPKSSDRGPIIPAIAGDQTRVVAGWEGS